MTSQKQIAANRRNAQKSTGPKTPEGKKTVARNALKHSLLARDEILIQDENAAEFKTFGEALLEHLAPEGLLESILAERVVSSAWRLRRAMHIESVSVAKQYRGLNGDLYEVASGARAAELLMIHGISEKIMRYETTIERAFFKALHELQRLQAARRGAEVPAPVAVDVSVDASAFQRCFEEVADRCDAQN